MPSLTHDVPTADPVRRLLTDAAHLPLLLTVSEAATLLGLSRSAAYRAVQRGELPAIVIAGRQRVPLLRILQLLGVDADPVSPRE